MGMIILMDQGVSATFTPQPSIHRHCRHKCQQQWKSHNHDTEGMGREVVTSQPDSTATTSRYLGAASQEHATNVYWLNVFVEIVAW